MDNMQRMPINAAGLLRSLPPHLQQVLGTSSLLPRIGGAVFMHALHENGAKATVAGAAAAQGTAAAAAPADATAVVATAKPAAVGGGPVSAAAAANGNLQPAKPGVAQPTCRSGHRGRQRRSDACGGWQHAQRTDVQAGQCGGCLGG